MLQEHPSRKERSAINNNVKPVAPDEVLAFQRSYIRNTSGPLCDRALTKSNQVLSVSLSSLIDCLAFLPALSRSLVVCVTVCVTLRLSQSESQAVCL